MVEDYDNLKENNLRQMVNEYENARPDFVKERQYYHDLMKEYALKDIKSCVQEDENKSSEFWDYVRQWTTEFYDNASINLIRKYAAVYDAKNLDKYPAPGPLLPIEYGIYVQTGHFPFVNTTLRKLIVNSHQR